MTDRDWRASVPLSVDIMGRDARARAARTRDEINQIRNVWTGPKERRQRANAKTPGTDYWRRAGSVTAYVDGRLCLVADKEKVCRQCGTSKEGKDFFQRDPQGITLSAYCRDCLSENKTARAAERHTRVRLATPEWADRAAIATVYKWCALATAASGVVHHVDHVIPLKGENVTGLHVSENLRVLVCWENLEKSNLYPLDGLEKTV